MRAYKRNNELNGSLIQGWYLSDELVSKLLANTQELYNSDELHYSDNMKSYYGADFEFKLPKDLQKSYLDCLNKMVLTYENTYEELKKLNYKLNKGINLQYWKPKEHYSSWHCEIRNEVKYIYRNLVFMTYLNDISTGGETEFIHQIVKINPESGLTVSWPANSSHKHRGCMTEEHKYAITGWFELIPESQDSHFNIPNRDENKIFYS